MPKLTNTKPNFGNNTLHGHKLPLACDRRVCSCVWVTLVVVDGMLMMMTVVMPLLLLCKMLAGAISAAAASRRCCAMLLLPPRWMPPLLAVEWFLRWRRCM